MSLNNDRKGNEPQVPKMSSLYRFSSHLAALLAATAKSNPVNRKNNENGLNARISPTTPISIAKAAHNQRNDDIIVGQVPYWSLKVNSTPLV